MRHTFIMKFTKFLLILLFMASTESCRANAAQQSGASAAAEETKVLIKTSLGDIKIKLYNDTPLHRDNFIKLVNENYYDGVLFHRVIKNFMVQAGDPDSKNAPADKHLGVGGPDYVIPAEIIYPVHFHKKGALSAARQADQVNPERASSGSQFYIVTGKRYNEDQLKETEMQLCQSDMQAHFQRLCNENSDTIMRLQMAGDRNGLQELQNKFIKIVQDSVKTNGRMRFNKEQVEAYTTIGGTPFLDTQYTVFGEVIDGMDVVDQIEKVSTNSQDRPKKDITIISTKIIK